MENEIIIIITIITIIAVIIITSINLFQVDLSR